MIRSCVYSLLIIFFLQNGGIIIPSVSAPMERVFAAAVDDDNEGTGDSPREENVLCSFKYIIYFFWYAFCAVLFAVVMVMDMATGCGQHYTKDFYDWFRENTGSLERFFLRVGCN